MFDPIWTAADKETHGQTLISLEEQRIFAWNSFWFMHQSRIYVSARGGLETKRNLK